MKALLALTLVGWVGVAHAEANQRPDNFMTAEEIIRRLLPQNSSFNTVTPAERQGTRDVDSLRQKRRGEGAGAT